MAAIKQLEEAMPEHLLSEDAEWFQAWKASGIDQEVFLPRYFRQLDLPGGERKCFTSAASAVAAYYKKIATQEEYERIRARYGDTTSVFAHVEALTSLGLQVRFVDNADAEDVMEAIDAGIPVMVGWLHQGNMLLGEPPMCSNLTCGHWSILHGYSGRYSSDPELAHDGPSWACQTLNEAATILRCLAIASACARLHFINVGKIKGLGLAGRYSRSQTRLHF